MGAHMHVVLVIIGGIILLGLFLLFGKLWGGSTPDYATVAKLFIPVWAIMAIINLWVGVEKAGYSVKEELPILIIVFLVPAVFAAFIIWRYAR